MKTHYYDIDLIIPNQVNKDVTFNEALVRLDGFCNTSIAKFIKDIPQEFVVGEKYIIDDGQHLNKICYCNDTNHGWELLAPRDGLLFFIQSEKAFFIFTNNKWEKI